MTANDNGHRAPHLTCRCGTTHFVVGLVYDGQRAHLCAGLGGTDHAHPVRGLIIMCPRCALGWCPACLAIANDAGIDTTEPIIARIRAERAAGHRPS